MDFLNKLFKSNLFAGNREKQVPKTFKDCYKTDSVSNDLWHWCEGLERWGKILFVLIIVVGLILAITGSITEKEVVIREATSWREAETELKTVFDFEKFIFSLLYTALSALLEYVIYHIIALFIGALATIVQSTRITANISLYKYATENNIPIEMNTENKTDKEIICDKKLHKIFLEEIKDTDTDSENAHWEESKLTSTKKLICNHCGKELTYVNNTISCPVCKTSQPANDSSCYNCGAKLHTD